MRGFPFSFLAKEKKRVRVLLSWAGLISTVTILGYLVCEINTNPKYFERDFVTYWSAGQLFATGKNPYNEDQILILEKKIGWDRIEPNRFWNPPWTLPFLIPFGMLNYHFAAKLWFLLNLSLVIICADWTWKYYGGSKTYRWLSWIIALLFFPTYYVLWMGQISVIVLFGILGILCCIKNQNLWLVGIYAVLATIKPHTLYLFWIAMLLWIIERRQWSVVIGMMLALIGATLIAVSIDPKIIDEYFEITARASDMQFAVQTPTLGIVLREFLGQDKIWLQFVPSMIGAIWLLFYWVKHHRTWDWGEQVPILLLISLTTTFFTWGHDQILLIIPVMHIAVLTFQIGINEKTAWILFFYAIINIIAVFFIVGNALWYIWMAPSFLLWYLLSLKYLQQEKVLNR